jgi:AbrB family looped-hinge helix DNA binding protein
VGIYVGVGNIMGTSELDDRGRVTIPKDIRDKAGLKSGDKLLVTANKDRVTIEKAINLEKFIRELKGCISVRGDLDPLKLKEIWRTVD